MRAWAPGAQLRLVNPAYISVALAGNKSGLKLWLCCAWTMHLCVCVCVSSGLYLALAIPNVEQGCRWWLHHLTIICFLLQAALLHLAVILPLKIHYKLFWTHSKVQMSFLTTKTIRMQRKRWVGMCRNSQIQSIAKVWMKPLRVLVAAEILAWHERQNWPNVSKRW